VELHQRLGRGSYDLQVTELEIEHIRRRVEQPQGPVHLEGSDVASPPEEHREDDLVDIARRDIFLADGDALGKACLVHAWFGHADGYAFVTGWYSPAQQ